MNIEPRLARIPGVGEVNVFGADYSLRIWLDPAKNSNFPAYSAGQQCDSCVTIYPILPLRRIQKNAPTQMMHDTMEPVQVLSPMG